MALISFMRNAFLSVPSSLLLYLREKMMCGTLCPLQRCGGNYAWLRPGSVNPDKSPGSAYTRLPLTVGKGYKGGQRTGAAWLGDFLNGEALLSQQNCPVVFRACLSFNFYGIPQQGVPKLAVLCVQTYCCCFACSDPSTHLACLVVFPFPVLGLEEIVSHWFPWMIYLLHVSIALSIADNLLVISGSRLCIRKICYELNSHFLTQLKILCWHWCCVW